MIAKLIVWDESRPRALQRLREALASYRIAGVSHNVEFLSRLVATASFAQANLDTGLIECEYAALFDDSPRATPQAAWLLAALAELLHVPAPPSDAVALRSPFQAQDGWRLNQAARRRLTFRRGEVLQPVQVDYLAEGYRLGIGQAGGTRWVHAHGRLDVQGQLVAQLDERRLQATVLRMGEHLTLFFEGRAHALQLIDPLQASAGADETPHAGRLTAPMPGKVIAWSVPPGSQVDKGAPLLVLEAMKMEHTLVAPRVGRVKAYPFAPGEQVAEGAELVVFEAQCAGAAPT